jgi:hypothetical protein
VPTTFAHSISISIFILFIFSKIETQKNKTTKPGGPLIVQVYIHERVTCIARSAGAVDQQFLRLAILLHSITFLPEL